MARSFNEKMEKKRQAEYNRWKAECNPVWHRRNHWLPKYKEDGTWEDSRAYNVELGCDLKGYVETVRTYNAAGELIRTEEVTFDNSRELARNSHGNCEDNTGKRRMRSVWNMATTASGGVTHYAKFPNELAERCILCGTAEGDVVLDPFVGSGTSCRVANRYGRQYIGD